MAVAHGSPRPKAAPHKTSVTCLGEEWCGDLDVTENRVRYPEFLGWRTGILHSGRPQPEGPHKMWIHGGSGLDYAVIPFPSFLICDLKRISHSGPLGMGPPLQARAFCAPGKRKKHTSWLEDVVFPEPSSHEQEGPPSPLTRASYTLNLPGCPVQAREA